MKFQKVVETALPASHQITNQEALNHLLSQVEWWHYLVVVGVLAFIALSIRGFARKNGIAIGNEAGIGQLRELDVNSRYQVREMPLSGIVSLLEDLDTGETRYYLIDTQAIIGGASAITGAESFQVIETHGGDMLQLCRLEVVATTGRPKLRHRIMSRLRGEGDGTAS